MAFGNARLVYDLFITGLKKGNGVIGSLKDAIGAATVGVNWWSVGIGAAITAISLISKGIEAYKQKLKEVAQEASKQADESAKAVSALSDLKTQLTSGTKSSNELTSAFKEQLKAMGYTEGQIDALINKYGGLSGAIDEATRKALENARIDAHTDVATSSKSLETTYDPYGMFGETKSTVRLGEYDSIGNELRNKILEIMKPVAIDMDSLMGTITMGANSDSAEDIYAYYQGLQQVVQLIQDTASKTNNKELLNSSVYKEASETLQELGESAKLYGDAIDRLNNTDAKIELANFLKTNDIATQEDFDSYIKGIEDGTIGMVDGKEASDAYKQVLIDVANDAFPQFSNATKEAGKNANEMTVSLSELKTASDNISSLSSAFKEISDDGYLSVETISKIQEATKLSGEEWESYKTKLLNAKAGSAEFNQIMSEMTLKVLEASFAATGLENATEDEIEAILRENGVVNASALAHEYSAIAKGKAKAKTSELLDEVDDAKSKLIEEAESCGISTAAYAQLVAQEIIFNNNDLDISDKISKLATLQQALGQTTSAAIGLNSALAGQSIDGRLEMAMAIQQYGIKRTAKGYEYNGITYNIGKDAVNAAMMADFTKNLKIDIPNVDYSGALSAGKSGSDNTPDYENPTDAIINRINLRADELAQQEEEIQNLIEIAELEKDYKKQISLTNDLIDTRKDRLTELETANAGFHNEAEWLRSSNLFYDKDGNLIDTNTWFNSLGEATETYLSFYNSQTLKEEQERVKTFFETVSKYKKAWIANTEEISEVNKLIYKDEIETIPNLWEELADDNVSNIEHKIELRNNADPTDYEANISDYEKIKEMAHARADAWRAAGKDEDSEEVQKWQKVWWDAENSIWDEKRKEFDARLQLSDDYIQHSIDFGWKNGDNEVAARKRVLEWIESDYYRNLIKDDEEYYKILEENRLKYNNALKEMKQELLDEFQRTLDKSFDIRISRLNSQSSLLSSHFNLINAISEEQHNLNKELLEAETVGARMNEQERETLLTKEEHTRLSSKLSDIMLDVTDLQHNYMHDLETATKDTIEEITNQYERQYELKMKEYEIVKAELALVKAQQILQNTENEKSVRTWTGSGWSYEANLQDVIKAQEDVENAKYELAKAKTEEAQQTALHTIDASADALQTEKNKLTSVIEDMAEKMSGSGKNITNMLETIAKTDLPMFDSIIKELGGSLKGILGISDEDINEIRSKNQGIINENELNTIIGLMKENSDAWHTADDNRRTYLEGINRGFADYLGLEFEPKSGRWKKKDGTYAYASGTKNTKRGAGLFDENGFGSELILTDGGVLTQFNGGERVFSSEMADRLWEMAQQNYTFSPIINQPYFGKLIPIEDKINNAISNISNAFGDTYMIKNVQLNESEGGTLKGFMNFLKKKI